MANIFHPKPTIHVIKTILFAIILTALALYLKDSLSSIFIPVLLAIWIISISYVVLAYLMTRFKTITLNEIMLVYTSGILSKKEVNLPYSKITQTNFDQTILERLFGLGTLRIDTASEMEYPIVLFSMQKSDVDQILVLINSHDTKA